MPDEIIPAESDDEIPVEFIVESQKDAEEVLQLIAGQARSTVRIGEILEKWSIKLANKGKRGSGGFTLWIEDNFDMSIRQAYRLIGCFDKFKGKYEILVKLKPTVQYALVEGNVPSDVFDRALASVEAGNEVILTDLKCWIAAGMEQKELDKGKVSIDSAQFMEVLSLNIGYLTRADLNRAAWPQIKENAQKIVNAVNQLEKAGG